MVSNTNDDLPEPDTPVTTVSRLCGIASETSLRLWTRAPRMKMELSKGVLLLQLSRMVGLKTEFTTEDTEDTEIAASASSAFFAVKTIRGVLIEPRCGRSGCSRC